MISVQLNEFIDFASNYLAAHSVDQNHREALLARLVKLNEEVGELNGAVLSHLKEQRPEKMTSYSDDDVGHEVADVIICALLLAKKLGISADKALEQKASIIRKRFSE